MRELNKEIKSLTQHLTKNVTLNSVMLELQVSTVYFPAYKTKQRPKYKAIVVEGRGRI